MSIRVNVDTEGLESARSALREAEELCETGFDHVSQVTDACSRAIEGTEQFKEAVRAAMDNGSG